MDSGRIVLHYSSMSAIPTYALYGETDARQDWLHWETIQVRSRQHGYRIGTHRHEQFFQALWLQGGSGEVLLDGTRVALWPGAVAVVPALTVHAYAFSPDVDGVVLTLLERDVTALGIELPAPQVVEGTPAVCAALNGLIVEADDPGPKHDLAMRAQLTLLLVSLARAISREAAVEQAEARTGYRARLHAQAFRQLVDQRFRTTRRIADYARVLGISEAHLNRICREVLGTSALQLIQRRIALEARRQLLFSDLSIKQIGADLGYDDPAYFTRVVTRVLGAAPGAVRRGARGR